MKKVIVNEIGSGIREVIKQDPDLNLRTGEVIQDQNGGFYKILGIESPCNPKSKYFDLHLEKQ